MASSTSHSLSFPHPELTPVSGEPTTASLRLLKKELYANARQIHSTRGGGTNGHLRIMMTDVEYLARANVAFIVPVHPGDAPVHAAGATGLAIAETIRLFNVGVEEHRLYETVNAELKQQLLKAVNTRYLQVLEDHDFGFADVSPRLMLTHLQDTYGQVTPDDIEQNRMRLSDEWNPDDPIEDVWIRISECQTFARNIEAITDMAAIRLTLSVFEKTGVFAHAAEKWRDKPTVEHTLPNFKIHFNFENKERLRKLTAQTAGFHGAHQAILDPAPTAAATAALAALRVAPPVVVVGEIKMYYCHTHGLGTNADHTSATCTNPGPEHKTEATISKMLGGNRKIYSSNNRPRPRPRTDA
jgi:hypothetical protein